MKRYHAHSPSIEDVRSFWEKNPLCAASVPHEPGTPEFFASFDRLREVNEPIEFSCHLHEYRYFKGKKVLDVGCGNGYVLSRYAREGAEVYGIDITETAVRLSRMRFELFGLSGNFRVANAEQLPFKDNSFDCVCSMGVLHHTPDTQKALEEVHRVLKPGGKVILMFYHKNSLFNRIGMPLYRFLHPKNWGRSHQTMINNVDGIGNPKGDVYTKSEMQNMLSNKFRDVKMFAGLLQKEMILPFGYLIPQRFLNMLASRWGWFLYIKGMK